MKKYKEIEYDKDLLKSFESLPEDSKIRDYLFTDKVIEAGLKKEMNKHIKKLNEIIVEYNAIILGDEDAIKELNEIAPKVHIKWDSDEKPF